MTCIPCRETKRQAVDAARNRDWRGIVQATHRAVQINYNKMRGHDVEALWRTHEMTRRAQEIGRRGRK